jgi:guanylate kinase
VILEVTVQKERLGALFVLVGPGGVGKNALLSAILKRIEDLEQLPTATTRPMRPNERQGREHQFVSIDVFKEMIADKELLEYQEVHPGSYYGVPRTTVEQAIIERRDMIADIDLLGAKIINEEYPDNSVSVFVAPPSIASLSERLKNRQASDKDIQDRLNRVPMEMLYAPHCDFVIVNDNMETATEELQTIIEQFSNSLQLDHEFRSHLEVSYRLAITSVFRDEILRRTDNDQSYLSTTLHQGDDPQKTALDFIAERVPIVNANPEKLRYESLDGNFPVSINYAPNQHIYELTYHYIYHLDQRFDPRDGWSWKRFD